MVWIQIFLCLILIIFAGTKLVRYGDLLAEKTGLGHAWIGVALLAAVTSIPELATGISSITLFNDPNLTTGNLLGANLSNLVNIAVIDMFFRGGPALAYAGTGVALTAALGAILAAGVALAIYLSQSLAAFTLFGRVSVFSLLLIAVYLLAQYLLFRFKPDSGDVKQEEAPPFGNHASLRKIILSFVLAAFVTAGAGIWLSSIGEQIVEITGLSSGFVGTLFLAICTSAPELVVSVSAARLGFLDMAVGNMVGSNLFNLGVVMFVNDLFYPAGSIFAGVDISHLVPAMFALIMSGVVIAGVLFRPRVRLPVPMGIDSLALVVLYLAGMATLYLLS